MDKPPSEGRLLESWKEISAYLKRSERTCRRWEETLSLPVHRLDGTPNARVFAYSGELDRWLTDKLHHLDNGVKPSRFKTVLAKRGTQLWALAFAGAFVFGCAFLAFRPLLIPKPTPVPGKNPILAIMPFENPSADKVLEAWRKAIPILVIMDLRQSLYLNVVPVEQVYDRLTEMKLVQAARLSPNDLSALGEKWALDYLVTGRLDRSGSNVIVEFTVRTSKGPNAPSLPQPAVFRTTARTEKSLLDKASFIARSVKVAVGLTRRQIAADMDLGLGRIATRSPEAMKLYSQAAWPTEQGPQPDMAPAAGKALAIDPGFGSVHVLMYYAYGRTRIEDLVRSYIEALSLRDRIPERDLLILEYDFYRFYWSNSFKLPEAGVSAETIARLRPKTRAEVLPVLERLAALYPDFYGSQNVLEELVGFYSEAEEWDKAISILESVGPRTLRRYPSNTQNLIKCYLKRGFVDKAEAELPVLERLVPWGPHWLRRELALKKRMFDEALDVIEKSEMAAAGPAKETMREVPASHSYGYYANRGYALWLSDDLVGAEKAYRALPTPASPEVEQQRALDLMVLSLSQGRIGQALAEAERGRRIAENDKRAARGNLMAAQFHYAEALLFRLGGQLQAARKEAETACLGYDRPDVPPGMAVTLLEMKARLALEAGAINDFEGCLREIRALCAREACPRFLRSVHYLRGLQELGRGHSDRAVFELQKALDLSKPFTRSSDPSRILFAMADAFESKGENGRSFGCYKGIAELAERESFAGDLYALSFFRAGKYWDDLSKPEHIYATPGAREKASAGYRKFLSLWGNADPTFTEQVEEARRRLAALESQVPAGKPSGQP